MKPKGHLQSKNDLRHPRLILVAALLALWPVAQPANLRAAMAHSGATLALQVKPAAYVSAVRVVSSPSQAAGDGSALVQLDLAVRLNPGTAASLVLYPASSSPEISSKTLLESQPIEATLIGNSVAGLADAVENPAPETLPRSILNLNRSGRYALMLRIPSSSGSAQDNLFRLELKSSDHALDISKIF